ncbi:MAG: hypothetical protein VKO39_09215 [Cyanobacteriota bacterium]|nr:hypothetical protein [Cyanobacteriota bacterium]
MSLVIISRCFYFLFILAVLASALPFQPTTPVWYLRLADAFVSNAPVLLLAILTSILPARYSVKSNNHQARKSSISNLITIWMVLYLIVIPVQLLSYGWLSDDSATGMGSQIREMKRNEQVIKTRLLTSASLESLRETMRSVGIITINDNGLSFQSQRRGALEAVENEYKKIETGLRGQRKKMLMDLVPGVMRTSIGGIIIILTLFTLRRQFD